MDRRGFIGGIAGILAAGFAPAAIGKGVLMPVRKIVAPFNHTLFATVHKDGAWSLYERSLSEQQVMDGDWGLVNCTTGGIVAVGPATTAEQRQKVREHLWSKIPTGQWMTLESRHGGSTLALMAA